MPLTERPIGVLCVEDNPEVAQALKMKLSQDELFLWKGWIPRADDLLEMARRQEPSIVLLDLDMPGRDPLDAADELLRARPATRVVVFSGHAREDLIERALDIGAWGFATKNDGENELLRVLASVIEGRVEFSPEVRALLDA